MGMGQKLSEWRAWSPHLILQNIPLVEQFDAQTIRVDRCLHKSSQPAPIGQDLNHWVMVLYALCRNNSATCRSVNIPLVSRAEGCDGISKSISWMCTSVAALSETPSSWKQ